MEPSHDCPRRADHEPAIGTSPAWRAVLKAAQDLYARALDRVQCVRGVPDSGAAAWNEKQKGGTGPVVWLSPEAPLMSLDDRAAHEQPDAHATALGRVEGIEQRVHGLW